MDRARKNRTLAWRRVHYAPAAALWTTVSRVCEHVPMSTTHCRAWLEHGIGSCPWCAARRSHCSLSPMGKKRGKTQAKDEEPALPDDLPRDWQFQQAETLRTRSKESSASARRTRQELLEGYGSSQLVEEGMAIRASTLNPGRHGIIVNGRPVQVLPPHPLCVAAPRALAFRRVSVLRVC